MQKKLFTEFCLYQTLIADKCNTVASQRLNQAKVMMTIDFTVIPPGGGMDQILGCSLRSPALLLPCQVPKSH